MSKNKKRSTIYFEPEVLGALQARAARTDQTVSQVVNEAVRLALHEDAEDLRAFEDRSDEPTLSYTELLNDLKSHDEL